MKRILQTVVAVGVLSLAATSFAASSCPICNGAASNHYMKKTGSQLVRGVANTALGWTELVNQPAKEMKNGGNLVHGLAKGVGYTVIRTAKGVGEIILSPMPREKTGKYSQIAHDCPLGILGVTDR